MSIVTFQEFRGQGIGSVLLEELLAIAKARRVTGVSLSIEDGNFARRIDERQGFEFVGRNGGSDTMLLRLA